MPDRQRINPKDSTQDWLRDQGQVNSEIVDVDTKGAMDSTLLHIAARTGKRDDVVALLQAGANPNALGDMSYTPLHDAAVAGQAEIAHLLLEAGANVHLKNEFGRTPREVAEMYSHEEVVRTFKQWSARNRRR